VYPDTSFYSQLAIVELPQVKDPSEFKNKLYDDYKIEIPLTQHGSKTFARISVQAYTTKQDLEALVVALSELLNN
jgi:isopenicillin-N epimerase